MNVRHHETLEGYNIFYAEGENVPEALGILQRKITAAQEGYEIVAAYGGPTWKQDDLNKIMYIATQALMLKKKDPPKNKK